MLLPAVLARQLRRLYRQGSPSYWDLDVQDPVGREEMAAALRHRFPDFELTPYAARTGEVMGIVDGELRLEEHLAGPPRWALRLPGRPQPREVEACLRRRLGLFTVAALSRAGYDAALRRRADRDVPGAYRVVPLDRG